MISGHHDDQHLERKRNRGFTIVELLIVVVVIAILAAITIVAYNGVTSRAKDSTRQGDVRTITQALELYYLENGRYPISSGSTTINGFWSTTTDASWSNLESQLVPKYVSRLPVDVDNTDGSSVLGPGWGLVWSPT